MKNFIQPGDTLELTAPAGGVIGGGAYLIGSIFGVAVASALAGERFNLKRTGVYTLPKAAGTAWSEGDPVYWDDENRELTKAAADNTLVGAATAAAASGATEGEAVLLGAVTADGGEG